MTADIQSIGAPLLHDNPQAVESRKSRFIGRAVEVLDKAVHEIARIIMFVAVKTLEVLNAIKNDCNALATFFRGVGYSLMGLQACGVTVLTQLKGRAAQTVNLIDTFQILGDAEYFATGKWKNDSAPQLIGRLALTAADVGGVGLWAEELGFGVSRAAAAIGKVRCFSFVPLIPVGNIVTGLVGVGFFFLGLDGAWRLYKTKDITEEQDPNVSVRRIKAILDMTWCGFEVAGKVVLVAAMLSIIPVAAPGVVAAFGATAACFGLLAFAYGVYNERRLGEAAIISDMLR